MTDLPVFRWGKWPPRPLTPREQAERDRQQQEAAGQLRLL